MIIRAASKKEKDEQPKNQQNVQKLQEYN